MAKISIDLALTSFSNFQAYEGNPPASEADYNNLKPWTQNFDSVWSGTAPTWTQVLAKQTELQTEEDTKCNNKVSAYRKLSMTDAEILAIDETLKDYL
jgi:hypothetical protein|tara:strand:- start:185 stop:478 length:294 start_codon:yes stop_codon:yes gene_type:complete